MSARLEALDELLLAATGDPRRFQGARYPHGKHARGRVRKQVKGRAAGRAFVQRVMARQEIATEEAA